jgi:hypothetical protein
MQQLKTIERRSNISVEEFQTDYLEQNRPVVITDAMNSWKLFQEFTPNYLKKCYGDQEVQLYDDLFNFSEIMTLAEYIDTYCQKEDSFAESDAISTVPYVRWYTKLRNYEFSWSDSFFEQIKSYWDFPYFLPKENYLLPYTKGKKILSTQDPFPGKAIFISAKNARTKLHYDPWCSDAVLCQIYGSKKIFMYDPLQKDFLCQDDECVDIEKPNYNRFSKFRENNNPLFIDILKQGEIIFVPNNWLHHVTVLNDSISLTWNFVHTSTSKSFLNYIIHGVKAQELEVIKFFLNKSN